MKLLYTDIFLQFINPTHGLVPAMVAAASPSVRFYGPGYSSADELARGILAFVEKTGPYDGIVLGPNVPILAGKDYKLQYTTAFNRRFTAFVAPESQQLAYYDDLFSNLSRLQLKWRFSTMLTFDCYSATPAHTARLEELDLHIIAPDSQFSPSVDEIPAWAWEEAHFVRKRDRISSAWKDFLTRNASRVVSLPHFVADDEFFFRAVDARRHRISIPGVDYLMREKAFASLRARGIKPAGKPMFHLYRLANLLRFPVYSRFSTLRLYNMSFQAGLIDSRMVYTAREGFGITVRKFMEIPASGALMLCVPPHGFKALGFVDGEHYIDAMPEKLADRIVELERDPERMQAIASAGQRVAFEKHSMSARARQLAECLSAIEQGTFAGSSWADGMFVVHKAAATPMSSQAMHA